MTVKAGLPWEFFAAIPCVIGLILGVARFNAPESVQWLKSKGRIKQAEESRLRLGIEAEEAKHEVKAAHQAALFKPINLKNLAYLSVFWFSQPCPHKNCSAFCTPARHLVDFRNYGCVLGSLVSGPSPNKFRCLSVALDLRIELWRPERIGLCLSG